MMKLMMMKLMMISLSIATESCVASKLGTDMNVATIMIDKLTTTNA